MHQRLGALAIALLLTFAAALVWAARTETPVAAQTAFSFTAHGDHGGGDANSDASFAAVRDAGATFSLALGDLKYSELATEQDWCDHVKSFVGPTYPFQLVVGNHEDDGSGDDGHINNFAACLPDRMGSVGTYGAQYYFDHEGLRVIMTAPDQTVDGVLYDYSFVGTPFYNWARDRIREAKALGMWVVVGMHENCITFGIKSCSIGENFMDLLIDEGVDVVLQGHDHNYQRSKQLSCADAGVFRPECVVDDGGDDLYTRGAGTVFVISGNFGGSKRLYNVSANDSEAGYFVKGVGGNGGINLLTGETFAKTYGISKFTVSSDRLDGFFVPSFTSGGGTPFTDSYSIMGPAVIPTPTPIPGPTPTPTPVPPGETVIHVADIQTTDANGVEKNTFVKNDILYWKVQIVDQDGAAVSGATVTTDLKRPDGTVWVTESATTGADGWTTLMSKRTGKAVKPGTYSILVTDVVLTGATYDPAANVETEHFFTITS